MADVQKQYGFTQIANQILENVFLFPFSRLELAVLFITMRFTYGFQRKQSGISIKQFAKFINSDKSNINKTILKLIRANVIKQISPPQGIHPRIVMINKNYEEWDREILSGGDETARADVIHSASDDIGEFNVTEDGRLLDKRLPTSDGFSESGLGDQGWRTLPPQGWQGEPPSGWRGLPQEGWRIEPTINKGGKKMKESSNSGNTIIYLVSEEEIKQLDAKATTDKIFSELDKRLLSLFVSCFQYHPNVYELESIKSEILNDDRLEKLKILKIVQDAFHKVAICDIRKRNTSYLLGVVKSMKQELYVKLQKEREQKEKLEMLRAQKEHDKKEQFVEGSILGPYKEAMEKRKREKKQSGGEMRGGEATGEGQEK